MAKKQTRKQMLKEPDEFLTFSQRMMVWTLEHKVYVAGVLGGLFALILIVSGVQYFSERAENRASAMLEDVVDVYETTAESEGPEAAYQRVKDDFQELLDEYAGRDAGKLARTTYANAAYRAGDFDTALEQYRMALDAFDNEPGVRNMILSGIAYAYEGKGDTGNAINYFEQIASGTSTVLKAEALFNLGRLYDQTGNTEKSRNMYENLIADYPDSIYIDMAKERMVGS